MKIEKFTVSNKFGNISIVTNKKTRLTPVCRNLEFYFKETTDDLTTIAGLQNMSPMQLISIKAKMVEIGPIKKASFEKYDDPNKQEGILVDPTNSIKVHPLGFFNRRA